VKILVVHQYYLLPGHPGGSRFNEFARMWSEAGHEVTVIAGALDYLSGKSPERYKGKWVTKEMDGNVTVYWCHVPVSYNKGYTGRAAAFLGFTLSASTAAMLVRDADVVIATSPPLIATIPGWIAARARFKRIPWIFEMRDLWPESAITTGVLSEDSVVTKGLYLLEKLACQSADHINVLTPAFEEDVIKRNLAKSANIALISNGADAALFHPGERHNNVREEFGWGDRFVVMYAGAHGRANALGQLVDAAEQLRDRDDVLIALVGDGPTRAGLEADAKKRGLTNIMFCGSQPKERMPDIVNACDVGAAVLQDNPTFRTVYPNKVFDYMSCERPTLLGIDGAARKLVCDDAKAGVFATPEDGRALAQAIRQLADDPDECRTMGLRGRKWVLENASRESLATRYLAVMEDVVSRSRSTS